MKLGISYSGNCTIRAAGTLSLDCSISKKAFRTARLELVALLVILALNAIVLMFL